MTFLSVLAGSAIILLPMRQVGQEEGALQTAKG
jgi:hypothetical protein